MHSSGRLRDYMAWQRALALPSSLRHPLTPAKPCLMSGSSASKPLCNLLWPERRLAAGFGNTVPMLAVHSPSPLALERPGYLGCLIP